MIRWKYKICKTLEWNYFSAWRRILIYSIILNEIVDKKAENEFHKSDRDLNKVDCDARQRCAEFWGKIQFENVGNMNSPWKCCRFCKRNFFLQNLANHDICGIAQIKHSWLLTWESFIYVYVVRSKQIVIWKLSCFYFTILTLLSNYAGLF